MTVSFELLLCERPWNSSIGRAHQMKGTNLSATTVSRLRENTVGAGGLHNFDLSNSNTGPKELALIAECVKFNAQNVEGVAPLISIDFSGNHICGVDFLMSGTPDHSGVHELVNALNGIGGKSRLKKINFSRNYLDLKAFSTIGHMIGSGIQSLSELSLRDCCATDDAIAKLMDGLKHAKSLQILDLSHNKIGLEGCEAIADALTMTTKLKQISLAECDIGPAGTFSIMKGMGSNISVEAMFYGDNNFGDEGAEAVASMLKVNTRLKHLDLQENSIGPKGMEEISAALKVNRVLIFLNLQWNELGNNATVSLCEALAVNNVLKSVHILGTQIDADGIRRMLDSSIDKKFDVDLAFAAAAPAV